MRIYHGERTEQGCEVTVDGRPLRPRSDLSGSATPAFEWGYIGSGQLSLALLSDFLGDDRRAEALAPEFEEAVIAELPHDRWTMTDPDLTAAIAQLPSADRDGKRVQVRRDEKGAGAAFGDMPVHTAHLAHGSPKADAPAEGK
jgi:hypothetical protein